MFQRDPYNNGRRTFLYITEMEQIQHYICIMYVYIHLNIYTYIYRKNIQKIFHKIVNMNEYFIQKKKKRAQKHKIKFASMYLPSSKFSKAI